MGTGTWETDPATPPRGSGSSPHHQAICGAAVPHGCRMAGAGPRAAASALPGRRRPVWASSLDSRSAFPLTESRFRRNVFRAGELAGVASGVARDGS